MIRRLLARLVPGRIAAEPRIYGAGAHPVRRSQISRGAQDVVRKLQQAGFKAFVVGGAVRDLLLGIKPKDFDIATDARPEDVKPLFRRAFIIGRRFRLVHVHVGPETIEVSTFRAAQTGDDTTDEHGRLLSDNVYGSQVEDATRRDFTINALYFDPLKEEVWDFVGGVADIRARVLKLIGVPATRLREDPVRMLRAVRLAAKLNIAIDPKTAAPIPKLAPLMQNVPAARLFDEMQKLLLSGHAVETLKSLRAHGLSHGLLPMIDVILEQPLGQRFTDLALADTDARVRDGRGVSPGFLFAALLWHEVLAAWKLAQEEGLKPMPALFKAMDHVIHVQAEKLSIPRRFGTDMKDIWAMQPRFLGRSGRRPYSVLAHPRFRAGYDFLVLRCDSGEVDAEVAEWWENFQHADEETRKQMLLPDHTPRRRRRRRKAGGGNPPDSSPVSEPAES